jgi:hypothetical protein
VRVRHAVRPERTTHQFAKTDTGGVQTVVADDPQDTTQITLVR